MHPSEKKIGFIGGGNMARAILSGLVKEFPKEQLFVSDLNEENCTFFRETLGIEASQDFHDFIEKVDIILIAIKPQGFATLLPQLAPLIRHDQLIISIAAGVDTETIATALQKAEQPIIRVMPNTPATIGYGASGLFANAFVNDEERRLATTIFNACGRTLWVEDEAKMSAVVALSGSSPAYFFYLLEIMASVGEELGIGEAESAELAMQSMLGAAKYAQESPLSLTQLKKNVMSPEGTTEQAIFSLERDNLPEVVRRAMKACAERDQSLSKEVSSAINRAIEATK